MIKTKSPTYSENIYFALYTFILMFAPPILSQVNILIPLAMFSLIMLLTKYYKVVHRILELRIVKNTMLLYWFFLLYAIVVMLISMGINYEFTSVIVKDIYRYFILIPAMWVSIIYLLSVFSFKKYGKKDIINFFLMAGILEFILVLLSFINPNIKQMFISVMYKNTGQQVFLAKTLNVDSNTVRFFGFANTLLDSFGYCMGVLAVVAMFLGIIYRKRYIIISFCLLFSTALNSRTGVLIFLIGLLLMLIFFVIRGDFKPLFWVLGILAVVGLLFIIGNQVFSASASNQTWTWIISGLNSILSIFTGESTSTYDVADVLFSESFWVLPKGINLIVGSGYEVTSSLNGLLTFHSDVGYINLIWQFGIIGFLMILSPYIYMFNYAIKKSKGLNSFFYLFLILIFFFVMIKFDATSYTPGTPLLIMLLLIVNIEGIGNENEY